MSGPLSDLPRLLSRRSRRASSWDQTGGNRDFITIAPLQSALLAAIDLPGTVRHFWLSTRSEDPAHLRRCLVRMFWDGEPDPSVEVPLGDFFGVGHARLVPFVSIPLQMAPRDARSLHCWFPMPFASARIEIVNEGTHPLDLYFHVDYEEADENDASMARFHAQWRRDPQTAGISETGMTNESFQFEGSNLTGAGNYVILEAQGRGHYVGCVLAIENLREVDAGVSNWYGEGDDMIFVDDEPFPPSLHGTGTEEYFGLAWGPREAFAAPYYGLVLPGGANWSGQISMYRFHIEDPIRFERSIRVTIEHGHANRRSDDYASTAFWYQQEPHAPFPALPPAADRLPRST
jgi:hypothetical protein